MPELKKTQIIAQLCFPEHLSANNYFFISDDLFAYEEYDADNRESNLRVFSISANDVIFSVALQLKSKDLYGDFRHYAALDGGLVIYCQPGLGIIPLEEILSGRDDVTLTSDGLQSLNPSAIKYYPLQNPEWLSDCFAQDNFRCVPLQIRPLNNTHFVVRISSPNNKSGRALTMLNINQDAVYLSGVYREITDDEELTPMVPKGFMDSYAWLNDMSVCDSRVWALSEGNSFTFNNSSRADSTLLSRYNFNPIKATGLMQMFGMNNDHYDYFGWDQYAEVLEGKTQFFSDNGQCLVRKPSPPAAKNVLLCQDLLSGEALHEIKLTPAQNLKGISLSQARLCFYDANLFLVAKRFSGLSQWNLCRVVA